MSPVEEHYVIKRQPTPLWYSYNEVAAFAEKLHVAGSFNKDDKDALKASWKDPSNIAALIKTAAAINAGDHSGAKFGMHGVYQCLREDVALFDCWDNALKKMKIDEVAKDMSLAQYTDAAVADKTAWVYSALIAHCSDHFSEKHVADFVGSLAPCSDLGKLEAVVNLLKSPTYRAFVWSKEEARTIVESVNKSSDPKQHYKCVFAYWLLSFDKTTMGLLAGSGAVDRIKDCLSAESKAEKTVRLSLKVLENFVNCRSLDEDMGTSDILEKVRALDYEKWNEQELYGQIQQLSQDIASTVSKVSNFERYKKELASNELKPGPLHSSAFWAHPDTQKGLDAAVIQQLVELVKSISAKKEPTAKEIVCLTVACSDLGEIAVQNRISKQLVRDAKAKDSVMELIKHADKDVRREALLCCQKIMLNKWNEISQK